MFTKIRVAVSRHCEMNCIYCPRGPNINMENYDGNEQYCMSTEEIVGIMSVLVSQGLKEVHFTGGEPLRRLDLTNLVQQTTALGAHVELNTNGLGVTVKKALELKKAGLDFIKISLDAPNRGAFLTFTGLDAFEKVVTGIKSAVSVMPVRLNCVVMRYNVKSLVPLIKMANELNVQKIHLLDLTYYPCVGDKEFWEREFIHLSKEVLKPLEREFNNRFRSIPIYGCCFYEMESAPGGTVVVLKEAQPTMRSESHCGQCSGYCHEGIFTLRLSAGGYLNFCPCMNKYGINALQLWREGKLAESLQVFSQAFDEAIPVDSFATFLGRNGLRYEEGNIE